MQSILGPPWCKFGHVTRGERYRYAGFDEGVGVEERHVPHEPQLAQHPFHLRVRKVDVRLPGKGNPKTHGARPVHPIITIIKWIRTSRLSIKNSLSTCAEARKSGLSLPLPSEHGTCKTATARFWPWLSGKSPEHLLRCCLFARQRQYKCGLVCTGVPCS